LTLRTRAPAKKPSFEEARAALVERLRGRREEIEQAVLTRAYAVSETSSDPVELERLDPTYLQGLRTTTAAAIDYALTVIEQGEEQASTPPAALLAQARLAARSRVGLDTVLRRYSAGYVLLSDFLLQEAERGGLRGADLQRLLRSQAALDRLLAALSEEYMRAERERPTTSEQRRTERIERLLAGELVDVSDVHYAFEGHHLALIARGREAQDILHELANALDCCLLTASPGEDALWAWLGARTQPDPEALRRHVSANWPAGAALAIGEPGEGLPGWRLSHRQAKAALSVADRSSEPFTRYADVALLAAVLQDDLLATSLRKLYLEPLEAERDGGKVAKETLRAYFAAGQNVSSAAAALGINRNTVASRLRAIDAAIGYPPSSCDPELEVALRLDELGERTLPPQTEQFAESSASH
jgi:diguanylate cyclase with GGDEF domain/PucR-like helix-turn-helix protein